MGYFSNASEGEYYCHNVCRKCIHYQHNDGEGPYCPILNLHLDFNYDEDKKDILNRFIPYGKKGNAVCLMFYEDARDHLTIDMFSDKERHNTE